MRGVKDAKFIKPPEQVELALTGAKYFSTILLIGPQRGGVVGVIGWYASQRPSPKNILEARHSIADDFPIESSD